MPGLPPELKDKARMEGIIRKNIGIFVDPAHWRLTLRDLREVRIEFLRFRPPEYDILFTVLASVAGEERTFYFYEGVLARKKPKKGERVYGRVKVDGIKVCLIDIFTSREFTRKILERWCRRERQDFVGFMGEFLGMTGKVKIDIMSLHPLFKPGEEPTANRLYRCRGSAKIKGKKSVKFDLIIKRFTPRDPADRGNREYVMAKALPAKMRPNTYGGLTNHAFMILGEPQLLVLFMDFIEGENIGMEIWDLALKIGRLKEKGRAPEPQLRQLRGIIREAIDEVIFPFHKAYFDVWFPFSILTSPPDKYWQWYTDELRENLHAMRSAGFIDSAEEEESLKVFTNAWKKILRGIKATSIHRDLMWRQILRSKDGKLVILDLDEHVIGHVGKDIADLCAANRFIAEDLPCRDRRYIRGVFEDLNKFIVSRYLENSRGLGFEWVKKLDKAVLVYLTHRHLHDAAYHLPIWLAAKDPKIKKRHKRYTDFSIRWFRTAMVDLKKLLWPQPAEMLAKGLMKAWARRAQS